MSSSVIGALRVTLGIDTAAFEKGLGIAQRRLNAVGKQFDRIGKRMQSVGRTMSIGVTAPILAFGVSAVRAAGDFESAMNRTAAVSGATGEELRKLSDLAKEMGRTTQFSASEAANALGFLAMAGFDAEESMAALPGTLQLASAAQMELAETADLVSNVLTGYGKDVSELAHINDVLTATFTSTNTDLQMLGASMKFVGPVASAAGVQFEETAAAIGLMGNAGIQGEMAGTALRGAISKILAPSKKASGIMADLGLNFTDAEGRLLPLVNIIEQLGPHADDAGLFMELFGQRAGPAMAGLVSQGSGALAELTTELENSGGTAARISETQMKGFNGAMKRLKSAFEGLQIAVAESGLLDWIGSIVTGLSNLIQRISEFSPTALKIATVFAVIAAAVGPLLIIAGQLAIAWGAIAPMFAGLATIMGTAGFGATLGALAAAAAPVVAVAAALAAAWALFGDKIGPVLSDLKERFQAVLGPKLQELFDKVKSAVGELMAVLTELWEGPMGDGIRVVIDILGDLLAAITAALGETVLAVLSAFVTAVSTAFTIVVEAVKLVANLLTGDFAGAWENAKNILSAFTDGLIEIGKEMVNGLVNGILAAPAAVLNALMRLVKSGWEGVKSFLGIASPSRLFMEVGNNISAGLANGISDGGDLVSRAFDGLNDMFESQIARTTRNLERLLVEPLKATATEAEKTLRALQENVLSILDRVFPDQGQIRRLEADIATLESARGTQGVDDAAVSAAQAALRNQIEAIRSEPDRRRAEEEQKKQDELDEAARQTRERLDELVDSLLPVEAEVETLREELALLDAGLEAGDIEPDKYARAREELMRSLEAAEDALEVQRLAATELGQLTLTFAEFGSGIGTSIMDALHAGIEGNNVFEALKENFSTVLKNVAHRSLESIERAIFGEGGIAGALDNLFKSLFQTLLGTSPGQSQGGGGLGSIIGNFLGSVIGGGRMGGGPVLANTPYIVGEKRPEVFVPSTAGRIVPNINELRGAAANDGSGMGGVTLNFNGPVSNPQQVKRSAAQAGAQLLRLQQQGQRGV